MDEDQYLQSMNWEVKKDLTIKELKTLFNFHNLDYHVKKCKNGIAKVNFIIKED
tara:strand:+ start:4886 stop:5047 length:162 start_codon:yes stop_codon:yes gene_type:complete